MICSSNKDIVKYIMSFLFYYFSCILYYILIKYINKAFILNNSSDIKHNYNKENTVKSNNRVNSNINSFNKITKKIVINLFFINFR